MVEEAHAFGRKAAAHCHTIPAIKMALKANVDTIEHCVFSDDETADAIAKSGKYMVPTLAFREPSVIEDRRKRGAAPFVIERMHNYLKSAHESFRRFHKAGVKFAMGTDTHVDPPFGENADELRIYVGLGLTPMEAIQTATRNAADALGRLDDLGTLEPKKLADMILVEGNPLDDIRILNNKEKIKYVIKDGSVEIDRANDTRLVHSEPPIKARFS
jgi:imidazolonepropionase-like amidohydrolase